MGEQAREEINKKLVPKGTTYLKYKKVGCNTKIT